MFLREHDFDSIIEKACFGVGLQTALVKALISVTSEFNPRYSNIFQNRYGLMGLQMYHARTIVRNIEPPDLMDPQRNIEIGVKVFRMLLNGGSDAEIYGIREEDRAAWSGPNYWDAVRAWSLRGPGLQDFLVADAAHAYARFCNQVNEPCSYLPREVQGVSGVGVA